MRFVRGNDERRRVLDLVPGHRNRPVVRWHELRAGRAAAGGLLASFGIADHPVTPGIADPGRTAYILARNGQTATITYGSTFGLASEANLICINFVGDGWTQK